MRVLSFIFSVLIIMVGLNATVSVSTNHSVFSGELLYTSSKKVKTLSQLIKKPNTTYEIKGNYDLKGSTLIIPAGCVLKGQDLHITNGYISLNSGCEIDSCSFQNVQVLVADAEHVRIKDCFFTGTFEPEKLQPQNYEEAAICCHKIKDCEFNGITISNTQWGIAVFDSYRISVSNIVFTGILDNLIDYSISIENANYHDAVHLSNTHFSQITNVASYNCGACVLLGRSSKSNVIERCNGSVLWDNGVYISSGNDNVVRYCEFQNVRGTGVKARGSRNLIMNNKVSYVGTGFCITGHGNPIGIDDFGQEYNGEGSSIVENVVTNFNDYGIAVLIHDGYPTNRTVVDYNQIVNGATERASISVYSNYTRVSGNEINCPQSFGVVVAMTKDNTTGGYVISNNSILCKRRGVAISRCKNATVNNNRIQAENQGVSVYETEGSSFIQNAFTGRGKYYVSGNIKGESNYYKTFGDNDGLKPSKYIVLDKR